MAVFHVEGKLVNATIAFNGKFYSPRFGILSGPGALLLCVLLMSWWMLSGVANKIMVNLCMNGMLVWAWMRLICFSRLSAIAWPLPWVAYNTPVSPWMAKLLLALFFNASTSWRSL